MKLIQTIWFQRGFLRRRSEYFPPRPGLFPSVRPEFLEGGKFNCWPIKTLCQAYFPRDYYTAPSLSVCVNVQVSGTKWICCLCHVFRLFSVKVCPLYKTQKKSKKIGQHINAAPYAYKLSVPGIQFRAVSVSWTHNNKPTNKR